MRQSSERRKPVVQIGPFDLMEPVGKGAMGEVWLARHRTQRVDVAVKFLLGDFSSDAWARESFANEVRAAAGLAHPAIVPVLDHGVVDEATAQSSNGRLRADSPYLVMEFVVGRALHRHVGRLNWGQARGVLLQLLDGLAHSHAHGVIHRDLKPGNVILRPQYHDTDLHYQALLTDFGLARAIDRPADPSQIRAGTPAYMAPEQLVGDWRDQGPWTDLYSFGCLTWALLSGDPPFGRNQDYRTIRRAHLEQMPPPLKARMAVPEGMEAWLRRLLAKDPNRRYTRAADAAWGLLCVDKMARHHASPLAADLNDDDAPSQIASAPPALGTLHALETLSNIAQDEASVPRAILGTGSVSISAHGEEEDDALPAVARRAPIPRTWRRPSPVRMAPHLLGVGLNLYGLRAIPVVGREGERDRMWTALQEVAQTGAPRVIVLRGTSGTGKTRLIDWMRERVHEVGAAEALQSTYHERAGAQTGLGGMLARHIRAQGLEAQPLQERIRVVLERMRARGEDLALATAALLDPIQSRVARGERTGFRSARDRHSLIRRLLRALVDAPGGGRPLVLTLDDVHFDTDGVQFAQSLLAAGGSSLPVLLVLTAQEESLPERPDVADALVKLVAQKNAQDVVLGPMPPDEHQALVQQLLGMGGDLVERVIRRTAGNPQFAVAMVGDWVERGLLEPGPDGFRLRPRARLDLPAGMHEVWSARVEHLISLGRPREARGLEIAAVLGMDVDPVEWAEACSLGGAVANPAIVTRMLQQRLAHRHEEGEGWSFAHPVVRECLERRARSGDRLRRHHRVCADLMRQRGLDRRGARERLARHLLLSGDVMPALQVLVDATEERLIAREFAAALRLLNARDRALRFLRMPTEDELWGRGWVLRARVSRLGDDYDQAKEWSERAARGAQRHGWTHIEVAALHELAQVHLARGQRDPAWEVLLQLERRAMDLDNQPLLGRCRLAMARLLLDRGQPGRARPLLQKARAHFDRSGDAGRSATCRELLGRAALQAGKLDLAREHAEAAMELHEQAGNRVGLASTINDLGEIARLAGDLDAAETHYREAITRLEQVGLSEAAVPALNLGVTQLLRGELEAALPLLLSARRSFQGTQEDGLAAASGVALLVCIGATGEWTRWDDIFLECDTSLKTSGFVDPDTARAATMAGDQAAKSGHRARARRSYGIAQRQWKALGRTEELTKVRRAVAALGRAKLPPAN